MELLCERGEANFDNLICISTVFPLPDENVYNPVLSSLSLLFLPLTLGGKVFNNLLVAEQLVRVHCFQLLSTCEP